MTAIGGRRIPPNLLHFGIVGLGTYFVTSVILHFLDYFEVTSKYMASGSETNLVDKFILILVSELGCEKDWWLTRTAGTTLVGIYAILVTLAISFSALFQTLCLLFIMWKKWNAIQSFVSKLWGEVSYLGVF
jgi:hypothetical protein